MSTVIRVFDELSEFDTLASEGRERWVSQGHNGASVLGNLEELHYMKEPGTSVLGKVDANLQAWEEAYVGRNKRFEEGV